MRKLRRIAARRALPFGLTESLASFVGCLIGGLVGVLACSVSVVRADLPYEQDPINYSKAPVNDPIARLQKKLDDGHTTLPYDDRQGYLPAVLDRLGIPHSSQVLVFSKTSFQRSRISPRTPRAIYFSDDMYIGWVQHGDVVEITAMDPQQGAQFYALSQEKTDKPRFVRHTDNCLVCHSSSKTSDVPGNLVRSVFSDKQGMPIFSAGTFSTNHESPFSQRWGGWYVSGKHGSATHMGNVCVTDKDNPERLDTALGSNVTDLSQFFDPKPYLTPHSDIVALMVLEHQSHMHNLITRSGFDSRMALWYNDALNKAFQEKPEHRSESTTRRLRNAGESLLRYLLYIDESPLPSPIEGTSGFTAEFAGRGPRDKQGRSLRDFDLQKRIFKYPCSYLIYSEQFRQLPSEVKDHFFRRLHEILTGVDDKPEFAKLSPADRQAVLEILRDTLPDLPDYWRAPTVAAK
ncbi:MAG: hypothetical protein U0939_11270 [Pirellulales bacterium]